MTELGTISEFFIFLNEVDAHECDYLNEVELMYSIKSSRPYKRIQRISEGGGLISFIFVSRKPEFSFSLIRYSDYVCFTIGNIERLINVRC